MDMDSGAGATGVECGICYSVAPPGGGTHQAAPGQQQPVAGAVQLPDVWCDNPRCSCAYHATCLVEWLREAGGGGAGCGGGGRSSFGRLYGECPYCKAPISVVAPTEH